MCSRATMGCPHSRNVGSVVRCGGDVGNCSYSAAAAAADVSATDIEFGCYGCLVSKTVSGPPAFSAEHCRLIKETWAKMSPQSTAIGKQVCFLSPVAGCILELALFLLLCPFVGSVLVTSAEE